MLSFQQEKFNQTKMSGREPVIYNSEKWIEENKQFFLPPVCNKMM